MGFRTLIQAITAGAAAIFMASGASADDGRSGDLLLFTTKATAAQEVLPTESDGVGLLVARFDRGLTKVHVRLRLRGIHSMVVGAHFHCARAGENGPVAFGLLNPGPLVEIVDEARVTLTNADNVAAAACVDSIGRPVDNIAALFFAMRDGLIYLNVHTADHPPGEVRGQMLEVDD